MDVVFTGHALDRWAERFAGWDIDDAYARSERVPCHLLMQQARACGRAMNVRTGTEHSYRRDRATGAVFACQDEEGRLVVITVLDFPKPKRSKAKDKTYGRRRPDIIPELEASEW